MSSCGALPREREGKGRLTSLLWRTPLCALHVPNIVWVEKKKIKIVLLRSYAEWLVFNVEIIVVVRTSTERFSFWHTLCSLPPSLSSLSPPSARGGGQSVFPGIDLFLLQVGFSRSLFSFSLSLRKCLPDGKGEKKVVFCLVKKNYFCVLIGSTFLGEGGAVNHDHFM